MFPVFLAPIDRHYRPVTIDRLQIEAPPSLGNGELAKLDLPVQLLVDLSFSSIFFLSSYQPRPCVVLNPKYKGPSGFE